jgi:hypothetical protein
MPESRCSVSFPFEDRLREAERAIERGWCLILVKGKVPIHKGWQRRKPAELEEVRKWLEKGYGLGMRTGKHSGVVVVDDDSVDGSAAASLGLPETVTVITGSGKRHFYFRAPGDRVGNSVKKVAPGVDIRGDGGQVVFVGSTHPDTGEPYRWAPGLSPDEVDLAELPEEIYKARPRSTKHSLRLLSATQGEDAPESFGDDPRIRAYVSAAFENELDRVYASEEGKRNNELNRSAFSMGQLVGATALDRIRVVEALLAAAATVGLPEDEARRTIESGLSKGEAKPRDLQKILDDKADAGPGSGAGKVDARPEIRLAGGFLHKITTRAERILLRQNPPLLYQRGTTLVRIILLPEAGSGTTVRKRAMIHEVTLPALVDRLTALICWIRIDGRSGDEYVVDCPEKVAKTLLSRSGSWCLPPLIGVIDCPTLRSDGGILASEGYDRTSGLYLSLANQSFPRVPEAPTQDEGRAALEKLLELLKGFPFLEEVDRSVALGAILTALIRPSLRTSPLFLFRAAKMGSGKSLLADVVSLIATGRPASVMSQGSDENEDRKRMLPILAEGDPVAVIDNIERPFESAALCSILTQVTWRDRILGKSQTITLPTTNTTWIATGNGVVIRGDLTTRTIVCDLDPRCERPEERIFDVNLHRYVPARRGELVAAGLTVLRAYHIAGRPDMELSVFGRFEEWSDWVRSSLVWLGMADPCETRRRVEEADPVREQLSELLEAIHQIFGEKSFRVSELLAAAEAHEALRDAIAPILAVGDEQAGQAQRMGMFLHRVLRRTEGRRRIVRGPKKAGSATWRLENV